MKKLFSLLLVVCMLAVTLGVFVVSTMAETEVVVWEGDINQEITTSNTIGYISADAMNQAIREDLAQNGPVTKYVLTSEDSYYIDGDSGYATWGIYQENPDYVELWSDARSTLNEATWTNTDFLSRLGQDASICLFSDTSDTAYLGHVKLVATHADVVPSETGNSTETGTVVMPEPTGDAVDVVNQGVKIWSGVFNQDFTTSHCLAPLDNQELSEAIYNDIAKNGVATAYAVVADMQYVSGESGYATFCLYQDDIPDYLEIWPDRIWPNETSFVWTDASQFAKMNQNIQLAICCDTTGDVIHLNGLAIYATHSGKSSTTVTEDTRIPEPTGAAVDVVGQGVKVWSGVFNQDFTTSHCLAPLDNQELSEAIYNDIAKNGVATAYAVVANMRYVSGESGYATFCFYQDDDLDYLELWPDRIWPNGTSFVWTDASQFALMNQNIQLAICCDTTGDVIHLNSLAIYAMHDGKSSTTVTENTQIPEPTGKAVDVVGQGVKVWSGVFNQDFTTSHTLAPLDNQELNEAICNDIAKNGVATAYAVVANMRYVSGESGYAAFCFYQEDDLNYLEFWPDRIWPNGTSFVWTDASLLALMNQNIQLAICSDTTGDVIHLNSLAIYAMHDGTTTGTGAESSVSESNKTEPTETEPSVAESSASESNKTEPTEPVEIFLGDANDDGAINMKDVLLLRKYLADMTDEIDLEAADTNGDGTVNMKDVLMLRKYLADLVDTLGA